MACISASFSGMAIAPRASARATTGSKVHFAGKAVSTASRVTVAPRAKAVVGVFAFKGSYQAEVTVGENEAGESAIRRFRRAVMSSGHILETRRRRYHENFQDIKKRKQSTPRKKKGQKPRTAAQALAEKEQAAMKGARGGGFRSQQQGNASGPQDGDRPQRR